VLLVTCGFVGVAIAMDSVQFADTSFGECVYIRGGGLGKSTWVPDTKRVDGRVFITLSTRDRDLVKCITGKGLNNLAGKHNVNCAFWSDLTHKRNAACVAAVDAMRSQPTIKDFFKQESTEQAAKRVRTLSKADRRIAPETVVVLMPEFVHFDGSVVREVPMRMVFEHAANASVAVELRVENFEYIMHAVNTSLEHGEVGRVVRAADDRVVSNYKMVYYSYSRRAFYCRYTDVDLISRYHEVSVAAATDSDDADIQFQNGIAAKAVTPSTRRTTTWWNDRANS
jgi:hypothetical protein